MIVGINGLRPAYLAWPVINRDVCIIMGFVAEIPERGSVPWFRVWILSICQYYSEHVLKKAAKQLQP